MGARGLLVVAVTTTIAAGPTRAEPAGARASALADEARAAMDAQAPARAIELWRQAYATAPSTAYLCNIGLALMDTGELARSHRYLTLCLARGDLPAARAESVAADRVTLEGLLRAEGQVAVTVRVSPPGALVTVPGWPTDEPAVSPTVVWLRPGPITLTARAPGHQPATLDLTVAEGVPAVERVLVAAPTRAHGPRRTPALIAGAVGVVGLGVGVGFHLAAVGERDLLRDELQAASAARDEAVARWRRDVTGMVLGYSLGTVALAGGAYLWWRAHRGSAPRPGDAPATLAWRF